MSSECPEERIHTLCLDLNSIFIPEPKATKKYSTGSLFAFIFVLSDHVMWLVLQFKAVIERLKGHDDKIR